MIGLLFLLLCVIWIAVAVAIAVLLTRPMRPKGLRLLARAIVVVILLPLPLADELLAKPQFERLCQENKGVKIDASSRGHTVYLEKPEETDVPVSGVRVIKTSWKYADVDTGKVLVEYATYQASGGWLSRHLTEGGVAQTFRGYCAPDTFPRSAKAFEQLGMKLVDHRG